MKVIGIETFTVEVPVKPLKEGGISPYKGSRDEVGTETAVSTLTKLVTDEGITGWGEMTPFISPKIMHTIVQEYIAPKILDKDPFKLREICNEFAPVYDPHFNTKALASGVEVACWDIMGKAVGRPICELVGGRVRDSISVAYCFGILELEETRDKVIRIKEEGFTTLKTKGGKNLAFDIERARVLREAAGSKFDIRVDMNQAYSVPEALRYLTGVEDYDLEYIEQPIRVNNLDGLATLRNRKTIPIAINEDVYIPQNFLNAIKQKCIDVAVVDYEPLGGIMELSKISNIAEEANVPLAHHCGWDLGIKVAAILQVTSAFPSFIYPMDSTYFAHEDDVLLEPLQIKNGKFKVPKGPGLGVQVDEEKVMALSKQCSRARI